MQSAKLDCKFSTVWYGIFSKVLFLYIHCLLHYSALEVQKILKRKKTKILIVYFANLLETQEMQLKCTLKCTKCKCRIKASSERRWATIYLKKFELPAILNPACFEVYIAIET